MAQATDSSQVPHERTVRLDIPTLTDGDTVTVTVDGETFRGPVVRVDRYSDDVDVERVVQFNMNYKHRIDGPDWEPWKAYLIEETAGYYRVNVVLSDGSRSRTRNLDAPDSIDVE